MVKVPPPRGKGDPPTAENTIGNLDKPEPEKKVPMNFWVPDVFHTDFKVTAAKRGKTMVDQLFEALHF
jgi:hypothetical protein